MPFLKKENEKIIIIQLEGKEAIDNLDEILEVDGYDIIFIGPYDLSQSLEFQDRLVILRFWRLW